MLAKSVKIRKKFDRWNRLSNDERRLKLSELYNKPVDDDMIVYLSELYKSYLENYSKCFESYDKLIKDINSNNNNYIFNILIETYPLIIPIIETIASINNIEVNISNLHLIYDKESRVFRKLNGIVYISGILIPKKNKFKSSANILRSSEYIYIMSTATFIRDVYELLKYEIINNNLIELTDDFIMKSELLKLDQEVPIFDIQYSNYKQLSLEEAQGFEHAEVTFDQNKEYDVDEFSSSNIVVDDRTHLHNIIIVINSNIFYNNRDIDNMYEINKLISLVETIKIQLNKYIDGLDTESYNIIYNVFSSFALLIVLIIKIFTLNEYKINTHSNIYLKFKNSLVVKSINKYGYVKQYLLYIFESLFDEDFKIMHDNKIKIDKIIDGVYKEYKRNIDSVVHNIKPVITEDKIVLPVKGEISFKLLNIFSNGKYSLFDGNNRSLYPYNHISDRGVIFNYNLNRNINKNIYYDEMYIGPKNELKNKYEYIKSEEPQFITIQDTNNSNEYIYSIINKLKIRIHNKDIDQLSKKMEGIGYLNKRQIEDNINILDTREYKLFILNVMKREWEMLHGTIENTNIDIYKVLDDYIVDTETAEDVYDYINHYIDMTKYFDISIISIENKRIKEQELREERINIYYNLTPEEKLEIDKFDFASDEWNTEISLRAELYTGKKLIPVTDEEEVEEEIEAD